VVLEKPACLLGRAVPEDDQLGACFVNARDVVAEPGDLLLAEQSPEVPDHCEDDRPLVPERAQPYVVSVGVEHGALGEAGDGFVWHGITLHERCET
jgi:hypothetical protein